MGEEGLAASVLDTGALIALERSDRRARAFLGERSGPIIVPATVLAQVWRDGARQVGLARLVRSRGTIVEPLSAQLAQATGVLLGRSKTSDIVDASVVIIARRYRALVLTTDPDDLRRIDPLIELESL